MLLFFSLLFSSPPLPPPIVLQFHLEKKKSFDSLERVTECGREEPGEREREERNSKDRLKCYWKRGMETAPSPSPFNGLLLCPLNCLLAIPFFSLFRQIFKDNEHIIKNIMVMMKVIIMIMKLFVLMMIIIMFRRMIIMMIWKD